MKGRFRVSLTADQCCADIDPGYFAELVRTVSQRLDLHTPADPR